MADKKESHSQHEGVALYGNILDSMDNGVIALDFEGTIITYNRAASQILGIEREAAIGKSYREVFFGTKGNDDFNDVLVKVIFSGETNFYREVLFFRGDNTTVPLGITCSLLTDSSDEDYGILAVFTDMTNIKKSEFLQDTLTRYVTKQVVARILENPDNIELDGEERDATILFTDIRGFTSITEMTDPRDLVSLLRGYFTLMVGAIFQFNGMVDKFIGDSIMAVYGAPSPEPGHARMAVETALEMQGHIEVFNLSRKKNGLIPIQIGIGISTGPVIVGNIGSPDRFEYTAIGDTVNLASRLEGINKTYGTGIIISGSTYGEIREEFVCRELDRVLVRGKKRPLPVYEVIGCAGEEDGPRDEFVGRYNESLALFRNRRWDDARKSFCRVLKLRPGDTTSELYRDRCTAFKRKSPPEDWDGSTGLYLR